MKQHLVSKSCVDDQYGRVDSVKTPASCITVENTSEPEEDQLSSFFSSPKMHANTNETQIIICKTMSLAQSSNDNRNKATGQTSLNSTGKRKSDSNTIQVVNKKKLKKDTFNISEGTLKPSCSQVPIVQNNLKVENDYLEEEYNISIASLSGSGEDEYTAPEYLDEDYLNSSDSCDVDFYESSETIEKVPDNSVASSDPKISTPINSTRKKDQSNQSLPKNTPPSSNNCVRPSGLLKKCSPVKTYAKVSVKSWTPKVDKATDFPVPPSINQYGDCLKTRLGRYHHGITLTDPPCQFFQGVLKGATGQTLAVMFGDVNLFPKFEKVPTEEMGHFVIDTTFRAIPTSTAGVNNLITISLIFQNETIPLWYAITSVSSSQLYKRILIEFQQHVLDWPFKSVLLNNDSALCKAVRILFPDIEIYGSWYYYCYSIWRELCALGLAEKAKYDETLLTAVKLLMVVPYLPPMTDQSFPVSMLEGFEAVRQYTLDNSLPTDFNEVLDFVATFWFNKVGSENFTLFGQTISMNFVELFQLSLISYLRPDGNIWILNRSIQCVAKKGNSQMSRYINGKPLIQIKNRGKKFSTQIQKNMKRLLAGTWNVKTFLEKSTVYCEDLIDIFLHPLYPMTTNGKFCYIHVDGWKVKI